MDQNTDAQNNASEEMKDQTATPTEGAETPSTDAPATDAPATEAPAEGQTEGGAETAA